MKQTYLVPICGENALGDTIHAIIAFRADSYEDAVNRGDTLSERIYGRLTRFSAGLPVKLETVLLGLNND